MESNRDWKMDSGGLDVVVQNTWTITKKPVHPSGYQEINYIHIPLDTLRQLRRLRPDAVVSLEMGARSILSSIHCRFLSRHCSHVLSVYASERSEAGRGGIRQWLRRRMLNTAKVITSNGPSCTRLLKSYGADETKILPWNYAADPRKICHAQNERRFDPSNMKLLTVGQLSERKGVLQAAEQLSHWADQKPNVALQWNVVGNGPLLESLKMISTPDNLNLVLHGHREPEQIVQYYGDHDWLLFPTLADEWGLVVDEAMHSGLPVLGSVYSQAATTLIESDRNGWTYDPEDSRSLSDVMNGTQSVDADAYDRMGQAARQRVAARTPATSASQLISAIEKAAS
jgi:glycosyltransferase involved in cell wall biosynthesis